MRACFFLYERERERDRDLRVLPRTGAASSLIVTRSCVPQVYEALSYEGMRP